MKRMTTVMLLILIISTPIMLQAQGRCHKKPHQPKALTKCYNKMFKQKKRILPAFSFPDFPKMNIPEVKMPKVPEVGKVAINIPKLQAPKAPSVKVPKMKKGSSQDCPH